jgi:hypothetical protein
MSSSFNRRFYDLMKFSRDSGLIILELAKIGRSPSDCLDVLRESSSLLASFDSCLNGIRREWRILVVINNRLEKLG